MKKWKKIQKSLIRKWRQTQCDWFGHQELFDDVKATLNRMPEEQARPLWLYAQGYKYEEIASMTGVPLGTVKSRIFTTRQELKESFNQVEY